MRFDPLSCEAEVVGAAGIGFGDIALTPNRLLYGVSGSAIYRIDTATAAASLMTMLPPPFNAVSLVGWDNERLLLESWDSLCVINLNGEFTCLGYIGYEASGDLTWYQGDLYMTAGYSALVRIRLNEDGTGIAQVDSIGVMPTAFGDVYGAVTVRVGPCAGDLRIIAFDDWDVYFVDPVTASTQSLCMNAFPFPVLGAATSAETEGLVQEPPARQLNIFTPNGDGLNDRFTPVAGSTAGSLTIFNRWGQEVHHGPLSSGWDGHTFGGLPCPEGVYFYIIRNSPLCSGAIELQSSVTLLR